MKAKLTEKLISMGWSVEIKHYGMAIEKVLPPYGGIIMDLDLPAYGATFSCYNITTNIIRFLVFESDYESLLNHLNQRNEKQRF